jgi:outer membrane receptor for ferrienterochelin and colicin
VGARQRWKVGVVIDGAQSVVDYAQFTRDDGSPAGGPDPSRTVTGEDKTNILSAGAFVQDEVTVGPVKVFPGARVDIQNAAFQGTGQPDLRLWGPSARLGFSVALSRAFTLHGFVGYLWQPPTAVDAAVAARLLVPGQTVYPVDIKAERDESAEVGLTYRIPQRLDATLTGFGRISQDTLDVQTVGSTDLFEDYNYTKGRAIGAELAFRGQASRNVDAFGNGSWNIAQGKGIDSAAFLFTPSHVAYPGWQTLDHVQAWTVNAGIDLHDEAGLSHAALLFQYGSGLRTGADNDLTVPGHSTWNLTLRHRFDFAAHAEVAIDVFNALDAVYAIRIANGLVGSAYGPLRQVNARLTVPFGG